MIGQSSLLRWTGSYAALSAEDRIALFDRTSSINTEVRERVGEIIGQVRAGGDVALRSLARQFDGATLSALEVPAEEWNAAVTALDPGLRSAMERSARNIRRVHEAFRPIALECESEPGIVIGRRPDALDRVGVYAPGGRAAYPSSVLMGAIPARVAGVKEIVLCSPPLRETGAPSHLVLAAAALAGVDRVFASGGAGAIAAMAFGTESIPRVDRIVGPGNAYVAEAKIQVSSVVAIDSPAGPSELLVLADDTADPTLIAREMLAQAEHDPLAVVVAVTIGEVTARAVARALDALLPAQPRSGVVRAALSGQGAVLWVDTLDAAIEATSQFAAEHVLLLVAQPDVALPRLRSAGTVFVGAHASVAFGDYMTGANHVLPTGGLARSYSGLSTIDFVRWTTYQRVTPAAAASLAEDVAVFADAEGLPGHAIAARALREVVLA